MLYNKSMRNELTPNQIRNEASRVIFAIAEMFGDARPSCFVEVHARCDANKLVNPHGEQSLEDVCLIQDLVDRAIKAGALTKSGAERNAVAYDLPLVLAFGLGLPQLPGDCAYIERRLNEGVTRVALPWTVEEFDGHLERFEIVCRLIEEQPSVAWHERISKCDLIGLLAEALKRYEGAHQSTLGSVERQALNWIEEAEEKFDRPAVYLLPALVARAKKAHHDAENFADFDYAGAEE